MARSSGRQAAPTPRPLSRSRRASFQFLVCTVAHCATSPSESVRWVKAFVLVSATSSSRMSQPDDWKPARQGRQRRRLAVQLAAAQAVAQPLPGHAVGGLGRLGQPLDQLDGVVEPDLARGQGDGAGGVDRLAVFGGPVGADGVVVLEGEARPGPGTGGSSARRRLAVHVEALTGGLRSGWGRPPAGTSMASGTLSSMHSTRCRMVSARLTGCESLASAFMARKLPWVRMPARWVGSRATSLAPVPGHGRRRRAWPGWARPPTRTR